MVRAPSVATAPPRAALAEQPMQPSLEPLSAWLPAAVTCRASIAELAAMARGEERDGQQAVDVEVNPRCS